MKRGMVFGKRAEMTSTQVVGTALLLFGFIILAILFFRFGFTGIVDREACHESVILRGTLSSIIPDAISGDLEGYVPLKCQTKKICATGKLVGAGDCEDFKGEKGIEKARVGENRDIEKLVADEVVDCWNVMGEGKVSLFSSSLGAQFGVSREIYPSCVICTRIAFDKESLSEDEDIDLLALDPLAYMNTHKVPNKEESYSNYITGTSSGEFKFADIDIEGQGEIKEGEEVVFGGIESVQGSFEDVKEGEVNSSGTEELAVLFMQISAPKEVEVWKNLGKVALGGLGIAAVSTPKKAFSSVKTAGTFCANPKGALVCAAVGIVAGGVVHFNVAHNRAVTASKCENELVGSGERSGCSVVRVTNYNVSEISQYCSVIESFN